MSSESQIKQQVNTSNQEQCGMWCHPVEFTLLQHLNVKISDVKIFGELKPLK